MKEPRGEADGAPPVADATMLPLPPHTLADATPLALSLLLCSATLGVALPHPIKLLAVTEATREAEGGGERDGLNVSCPLVEACAEAADEPLAHPVPCVVPLPAPLRLLLPLLLAQPLALGQARED